MNRELPLLNQIDIAAPCTASWEEMAGNDQVRFCSHCQLNVYNLSEMPRKQADDLVRSREGRLCVRFFRRHDGTMLTRDCPVGIRALRQRLVRSVATLAGLFVALVSGTLLGSFFGRQKPTGNEPTAKVLQSWLDPWDESHTVAGQAVFLGDVCPPTPPSSPPGTAGAAAQEQPAP